MLRFGTVQKQLELQSFQTVVRVTGRLSSECLSAVGVAALAHGLSIAAALTELRIEKSRCIGSDAFAGVDAKVVLL